MRISKAALVVICGCSALFFNVHVAVAASALDGKEALGKITRPGETKIKSDTLIFKDGKFRSTACDQYGFESSSYETSPNGSATTFEATTKNKAGNTILWHGIITGEKVTATALWSDAKGETDTFAFTGKVK